MIGSDSLKHNVYIGMGSNLNDRKNNLERALVELKKIAKIDKISSLYESHPWGYTEQDNFYNAVLKIKLNLEPLMLLSILKGIELKLGRSKTFKWGPRIIDLDILFYDSLVLNLPSLKIPHPEIKNRLFVLLPLIELKPDLIDPETEKPLSDFLDSGQNLEQNIRKISHFDRESWSWDEIN